MVAASGDLTQRARPHEFRDARALLDRLPTPQIVVPGNHDVPLYNVAARVLHPLRRYQRYVTDDLRPFYADDEIAVPGVNTARALTIRGGRINNEQVSWMSERFRACDPRVVKVVVTHHPFDLPDGHDERHLVRHARAAMEALAACGADLFLAGHLRVSHTSQSATRYAIAGHFALVVQAGTAASGRGRGEENAFNALRIAWPEIAVERFAWQPGSGEFTVVLREGFRHTAAGWTRLRLQGVATVLSACHIDGGGVSTARQLPFRNGAKPTRCPRTTDMARAMFTSWWSGSGERRRSAEAVGPWRQPPASTGVVARAFSTNDFG